MTESAAIATEPAQTSATPPAATLPPEPEPTATPATPAGTTPPATAEPDSDRPSRAQGRIEELSAEKIALREAAEYWRNRALATPTSAAPAPTDKPAPKVADFESVDAWAEAHATWVEQRVEQRVEVGVQQRVSKDRTEQQRAQNATAFEAREVEFAKTTNGYREVVSNPMLARYTTPMIAEVIQTSEKGPALSFHLATHVDELARISRLTPAQQATALGRLEVELSKPTPPVQKGTTKAPEPPNPVGGGQPTKDIGAMSIGEYLAHRKTWPKR